MARSTALGLHLLDLRRRRRAAVGLRRAFPELGDAERRRLARLSLAAAARGRRSERRALGLAPVELCRRLTFEGWEHLHNATAEPLFLFGPLGAARLASRVVELYHQGRASAAVVPPPVGEETVRVALFRRPVACSVRPARLALEQGAAAFWTLTLPARRNRWCVHFLPPVVPRADDTVVSLLERYLSMLEGMIRRHPAHWPWSDFE